MKKRERKMKGNEKEREVGKRKGKKWRWRENRKVVISGMGGDLKYAQCFSQEEEIGNARYEKRRMSEKWLGKRIREGTIGVKEAVG